MTQTACEAMTVSLHCQPNARFSPSRRTSPYNTKQVLKDRFGDLLPASLIDFIPEGLEYNWFYSDSKAETSIPSEVNISLQGATDENFQIPNPQVVQSSEAANFRFTELDDDVLNHGWEVKAPFYTKRLTLSLSEWE